MLLYSRESIEFTNDIIAVLNKPGRASSSADTASSPAAPTSPAASSPAKPKP
jgi:hypothetical protein